MCGANPENERGPMIVFVPAVLLIRPGDSVQSVQLNFEL